MNGRRHDDDNGFQVERNRRLEDYFLPRGEWREARDAIKAELRSHEERFRAIDAAIEAGRSAREKLHQEHIELSQLIRVRAGQAAILVAIALFLANLFGPRMISWLWPG